MVDQQAAGRQAFRIVLLVGLHVVGWARLATAEPIAVSGAVAGRTPAVLGYNSGHFLPGSNTAAWWKYSGVNGSRIFSNLRQLTPASSFYSQTDAALDATTQAAFEAQRAALRAKGPLSTYVDWRSIHLEYFGETLPGSNAIQPNHAQAAMATLGIRPLIVMTRSPASYPWPEEASDNSAAAWQARWLAWQQWYAHAFVHARFNDVAGFQFFNEPDLYSSSSASLSQEQLVEMIRYGADAAQAAIADVNRFYGKSLEAVVYAPVTSGPKLDAGNWGETVVANHANTLLPTSSPDGQLFQRFAYHNYGSPPERFGQRVAETRAGIDRITGGEGSSYPIAITEFNTRTSADYATDDPERNPDGYTPDSLEMSSRLGQILVNLANNQPEELYLFKFSNAGGANNGVHWQSGTGVRDVGGVTRSGMVYQLFVEGFTGGDLLEQPPVSGGPVMAAARAGGSRYLFAANPSLSQAAELTLDLSGWDAVPGSRVTVRQVSDVHQGDISQVLTVAADRTVRVAQDPGGVVLVRVPTNPVADRTSLAASELSSVSQGRATTTFAGGDLRVGNSGTDPTRREVAFLKFPLAGIDRDQPVSEAILDLSAWNPDGDTPVVTHVYGLAASDWTADTLTWSTAPNLRSPAGTLSLIDDKHLTGVGQTADIVGQFVATGAERRLAIDVSDWIQNRLSADAESVSFLISRDIRFDGDLAAASSMVIRGGDADAPPALMVATRPPAPEPGTLLWYGDDLEAGGAGLWSPEAVAWWNGETLQAWDPSFTAVFAGSGGLVTLAEGVTAAGVRIEGEGYRLAGDATSLASLARIDLASGATLAGVGDGNAWVVAAGQTLAGEGTIGGSVIFGGGATLAPGGRSAGASPSAIAVPEPAAGPLTAIGIALVGFSALAAAWPRERREAPPA